MYISEKHQMLSSTKAHVSSADHVCLIRNFFFNINSLKTINGLTSRLQHRLLTGASDLQPHLDFPNNE